ncbi:MAG: 4-hydroxy-tetrahydrodipicolinate synthase [Paludibacterium sp.]|uniref:4-hydroxy-tetrahydrodipicolinate synthase n=1 Tax=Paludibacterium sp. TaxID=1917523 RepID=UPI0025F8A592|nr:4-hydroxy-tetrahydrodipicolinate synthase [Paludibacterium sp.]MBV8049229.1 4-hydroxy-tetrahydrodipicolinate synthase [Paludibacterium sp.]MBV8646606.1 4-hydroxy-tetrahydrodipicolinate synthase [Paludibacterium sp.]
MDFSGIWVPLVTPFRDGQVDHVALRALVEHYRQAKVAGLVALGTTGEAAALEDDEQLAVVDCVLAAAGDLPVIVGLAGNHLGHLRARLAAFCQRPIAGLLTPAPYYIRPSQQGLVDYFTGLAEESTAPLVLYDIPYRTGVRLELETLLMLAGHDNIAAIKDCAGSVDTTQALIADGRLQVLAGEDMNILNTLCMGGVGAIAASAHIRPDLFVALAAAVDACDLPRARAIFHALAPMMRLMFAEANPGPVKAALALQGRIHNALRAPMCVVSQGLEMRLGQALPALDQRARGLAD